MQEYTIEELAAMLGITVEAYNVLRRKAAEKAQRDLGIEVNVDDIEGPFPAHLRPQPNVGMFLRLTPQKGNWAWAHLLPNGHWRRYATRLDRALEKAKLTHKRPSGRDLVWCGFARQPA